MKIIIQRVIQASVKVDNKIVSKIDKGYLLLVSFTHSDNKEVIDKMIDKLLKLRLFEDENGKINLSINEVKGKILSVPQFSLYASVKKGNRPSFEDVLKSEESSILFDYYKKKLTSITNESNYGIFKADMKVSLINDGPLTIVLDSDYLYGKE